MKSALLLALTLLILYLFKKLIQLVRDEFFQGKDEAMLNKLDKEANRLMREVVNIGKNNMEGVIRGRMSKSKRIGLINEVAQSLSGLIHEYTTEQSEPEKSSKLNQEDELILAALTKLGFKRQECLEAIKKVPTGSGNLEARIKETIKILGRIDG